MKLISAIVFAAGIFFNLNTAVYAADEALLQRLDRIERLMQSQGLLDMLQQIEALQREVNALRGQIELQNHSLEQMKNRQRDLYTDIDQRLQRMERRGQTADGSGAEITFVDTGDEQAPPLETIAPVANAMELNGAPTQAEDSLQVEVMGNNIEPASIESSSITASGLSVTDTGGATDMPAVGDVTPAAAALELDPVQIRAQYQQAFKLLKQSQYEQAIKAFREFLNINPRSEFSDNAQYWLGEAYYVTRQFDAALAEYTRLLENYPESKKLTHSLLKIGFCYYEMGEIEEATVRLEKLKQQYPDTTAARLADERLKKIAQAEQQAGQAGQAAVHAPQ